MLKLKKMLKSKANKINIFLRKHKISFVDNEDLINEKIAELKESNIKVNLIPTSRMKNKNLDTLYTKLRAEQYLSLDGYNAWQNGTLNVLNKELLELFKHPSTESPDIIFNHPCIPQVEKDRLNRHYKGNTIRFAL